MCVVVSTLTSECSISTVSQSKPARARNRAAVILPRDNHVPTVGLPAFRRRLTVFVRISDDPEICRSVEILVEVVVVAQKNRLNKNKLSDNRPKVSTEQMSKRVCRRYTLSAYVAHYHLSRLTDLKGLIRVGDFLRKPRSVSQKLTLDLRRKSSTRKTVLPTGVALDRVQMVFHPCPRFHR